MNKVYGVLLSPFVRKVLMTLEVKQQRYETVTVMPGSSKPAFRAISPMGKIPAYEDEYLSLCDSSVICQYLEDKYRSPAIYPHNPRDKARALWLEEYADTKLMELLGGGFFFELLVAPRLMGRPADHNKVRASIRALPPFLTYLEKQIHGPNYLVGAQLSIADLSVPSVFINAHYAGYKVDTFSYPKLSAYLNTMWRHPLYEKRFEAEKEIAAGLGAVL
jgi:glutathione S-transferase